jgi:hypothetical protein
MRPFEVDDLSELGERQPAHVTYLAYLLERAKTDPAVKEDILGLVGWRPRAGRPLIRKGEFGEVVAAAELEEFDRFSVPIKKLRHQIDPEQTQPGNDVVAFVLSEDGEIQRLVFAECKLRTTSDVRAATAAHAQLVADREIGFADILAFILKRFHEQRHPLLDPLRRYLRRRDISDRGDYQVALIWDGAQWGEAVIDRLDPLPDLLDPLTVRVTLCMTLADLVDEVFNEAGMDIVEDEE